MKSLLPFKLVYHDRYDLNLGPHVFPSQKFRLIYEMLLRESLATEADFLRPNPASDEDILRVHTADWVRKLKTGTLTASDVMRLEVPYSPELVEAVWLAAVGSDKSKLLSATIYLANMASYNEMNEVWDAWVDSGDTPARATVEARLAQPKFLVEISVVAGL